MFYKLMPLYMMDMLHRFSGLPGLLLSCIFSGCLRSDYFTPPPHRQTFPLILLFMINIINRFGLSCTCILSGCFRLTHIVASFVEIEKKSIVKGAN